MCQMSFNWHWVVAFPLDLDLLSDFFRSEQVFPDLNQSQLNKSRRTFIFPPTFGSFSLSSTLFAHHRYSVLLRITPYYISGEFTLQQNEVAGKQFLFFTPIFRFPFSYCSSP